MDTDITHYELDSIARVALSNYNAGGYSIKWPNVKFSPPSNGDIWLKYSYFDAVTDFASLSRTCILYTGLVQIDVMFPPDSGTSKARLIAKDIAAYFKDGTIIGDAVVSMGATLHPLQKHETGWFQPVRFSVSNY